MATLELPWAALNEPTTWYRQPSVKVAFVVSLLIHAAAIALLPSLRVPEPPIPPPLTVELVPQLPPPVPAQVPAPPAPVVKATPKPVPPPPLPEAKPELQPEPPPVVETRAPPPPPQPIVVPQRLAAPEPQVTAPPRVETPPQAHVEPPPPTPAPAPRVQAPLPVPTLDANVLREYGAVVSSVVAKKKVYPRMALMRRWQGTTDLKLQIAADGNVKALSVAHSSGFDILDEQAVKMVKDAMPLPGLPDALRGREFAIDIPVVFRLQE
jgi:protein TonB